MLIKYGDEIVNLVHVERIENTGNRTIRFFFHDDFTDLDFDDEKGRNEAWTKILADYAVKASVCLLD